MDHLQYRAFSLPSDSIVLKLSYEWISGQACCYCETVMLQYDPLVMAWRMFHGIVDVFNRLENHGREYDREFC